MEEEKIEKQIDTLELKNPVTFITAQNLYSGRFWNNPEEVVRDYGRIITDDEEKERLEKIEKKLKNDKNYKTEYITGHMITKLKKKLKNP